MREALAAGTLADRSTRRPQLLLVPWLVAGVQTQYEHLRTLPAVRSARVIETVPYRAGGAIERLPLPSTIRGTLRSTLTVSPALLARRPAAVWTQVALPMLPFALTRGALGQVPIFYAIDCTPALLHGFGGLYSGVADPTSRKGRAAASLLRTFLRLCAGLLPWSAWAARSMIQDYGARPDRVEVIPPGIDLSRWSPRPRPASAPARLLFIGGDFERKGGPLLLDLFRRRLRGECELVMVTRAPIEPEAGIEVHRDLNPGEPRLRDLYRSCDALVIPTLADCFSMAALEAMACGLPVVISAVGGIPEIVRDGQTGFLVTPGDGVQLYKAIRRLLDDRALALAMGAAGRRRAEDCYDAGRQATKTLSIIERTLVE
ncbi:MAG: glycosyltransferase family 4 protein [Chloroflexi bacterium]|nr:MAG: glycosyltransferase family 4 protein [Chloroflexota bacterium]